MHYIRYLLDTSSNGPLKCTYIIHICHGTCNLELGWKRGWFVVAIVANSVEKEVSTKHNILCHPVGIRLPTFLHRLKLKDRIINTNMTVRYGQETTVKRGLVECLIIMRRNLTWVNLMLVLPPANIFSRPEILGPETTALNNVKIYCGQGLLSVGYLSEQVCEYLSDVTSTQKFWLDYSAHVAPRSYILSTNKKWYHLSDRY